jgi:hypothetical protein
LTRALPRFQLLKHGYGDDLDHGANATLTPTYAAPKVPQNASLEEIKKAAPKAQELSNLYSEQGLYKS